MSWCLKQLRQLGAPKVDIQDCWYPILGVLPKDIPCEDANSTINNPVQILITQFNKFLSKSNILFVARINTVFQSALKSTFYADKYIIIMLCRSHFFSLRNISNFRFYAAHVEYDFVTRCHNYFCSNIKCCCYDKISHIYGYHKRVNGIS